MYKAIIFDFFGVIHSDPAARWFKKHAIERAGDYADVFKNVDYGMITMEEAYARLSKLSGQKVEDIKQIFGQTDMIDHDVVELIKNLRMNYKLGLLSNAISNYLTEILRTNQLSNLFDEVVISGSVGYVKPEPEIYELMLEKLGMSAQETIFIDDNERNVAAANDVGIKGIWFEDMEKLRAQLDELAIKIS